MPVLGHFAWLNTNSKEFTLFTPGLAACREICPSAEHLSQPPPLFRSYLLALKYLFPSQMGPGSWLAPGPQGCRRFQAPPLQPRAEPGEGLQEELPLTSAESEIMWAINYYSKYMLMWPDLK